MKASFFLGDRSFIVKETVHQEPQADEVAIKVGACGVCGTDVHIYYGEQGSAPVLPPVTLGHEFAGEVVAVGSAVKTIKVGDHVTIDPNIYCGKCDFCKQGRKQLCENLFAVGVNRNGGFAEYCNVPETQCLKLLPEIPYEIGAMAEPLACCIHGVNNISIEFGDKVCIIGGGAIGLIMLQLAKLAGAAEVIVSEPVKMRRAAAMQLGADGTIDPVNENLNERFAQITGKSGADVVIECVGNARASSQALQAAGKGGKVLIFSVPKPDTTVALNLSDMYQKELTVKGSFINPDTQKAAVDLINSNKLDFGPIITHRFHLDEIEAAIKKQLAEDSLKVVVMPDIIK